jgi:hypothetical protein
MDLGDGHPRAGVVEVDAVGDRLGLVLLDEGDESANRRFTSGTSALSISDVSTTRIGSAMR